MYYLFSCVSQSLNKRPRWKLLWTKIGVWLVWRVHSAKQKIEPLVGLIVVAVVAPIKAFMIDNTLNQVI